MSALSNGACPVRPSSCAPEGRGRKTGALNSDRVGKQAQRQDQQTTSGPDDSDWGGVRYSLLHPTQSQRCIQKASRKGPNSYSIVGGRGRVERRSREDKEEGEL